MKTQPETAVRLQDEDAIPWAAASRQLGVEVSVRAEGVVIRAAVPGLRAEDLGLVVGEDWLDLCVEAGGARSCTIRLPDGVEPALLELVLEDDALTIRIPWAEPEEALVAGK